MSATTTTNTRERIRRRLPSWGLAVGFALATVWVATGYIRSKLKEAGLRASAERKRREGLRNHFTSTMSDVSFTVYALFPTVYDQLVQTLDVESLFSQLRELSNKSGTASMTNSQQLSVVSDDSSSAVNASKGQSPSMPSKELLPDSWASEFESQRLASGVEESPVPSTTRTEDMTLPSGAYTSSIDGESIAISSPSQTLSLSIDSQSPPPQTSAGNSPPLLHSPTISPRTQFETLTKQSPPRVVGEAKAKAKLWNEVKVKSITRAITSIYLIPLIILQTSSQLSIMARRQYLRELVSDRDSEETGEKPTKTSWSRWQSWTYFSISDMGLSSVIEESLSSTQAESTTEDDPAYLDRIFLCFSWWLLHVGWQLIEERVASCVQEVCGEMKLKQPVTAVEWSALIRNIRAEVDSTTVGSSFPFSNALLPPSSPTEIATILSSLSLPPGPSPLPTPPYPSHLSPLLEQMNTHFQSPDFSLLNTQFQDSLHEELVGELVDEAYMGDGEGIKKLAECLPCVGRWGKEVWMGYPDKAVDRLLASSGLQAFSALIFGDFGKVEVGIEGGNQMDGYDVRG